MNGLHDYSSGVATQGCDGDDAINHAVVAVGFGTDGQDYFKIRNSWGAAWGAEGGYFRLAQVGGGTRLGGGSRGAACLYDYGGIFPALSVSPTPTPTPPPPPPPTPPPPTPPPPGTTCHCDNTDALPPNNHFTCADALKSGYCGAEEKCKGLGDWDFALLPCRHATICSCDSPGQIDGNQYTCLDSEFSGYCEMDQMCNIEGNWEHPVTAGGDFISRGICVHADENVIV